MCPVKAAERDEINTQLVSDGSGYLVCALYPHSSCLEQVLCGYFHFHPRSAEVREFSQGFTAI